MTHPSDRPLGPQPQQECHWSHHDGARLQYDFMCLLPMAPEDAKLVIEVMKLAMNVIARSSGMTEAEKPQIRAGIQELLEGAK